MAANMLVVEDSTDLHVLIQHILAPLGQVTYVTSGEEARVLLSQNHFDLVLSDQELDGRVSGIDLYLTCRKQYPATAFLLISGFPGNVFQKLISTGIECPPYVDKPFSSPQLRNSVQRLLQSFAAAASGQSSKAA